VPDPLGGFDVESDDAEEAAEDKELELWEPEQLADLPAEQPAPIEQPPVIPAHAQGRGGVMLCGGWGLSFSVSKVSGKKHRSNLFQVPFTAASNTQEVLISSWEPGKY
jgi:hypothetical protein